MPKLNKYLFIIFIALLIVTLGELSYYYLLNPTRKSESLSVTDTTRAKPTVPIPTANPDKLIDEHMLDILRSYKKGILKSTEATFVSSGVVSQIDTDPGFQTTYNSNKESTTFPYVIKFTLTGTTGASTIYFFSKEDLKKVEFTKNDQKAEIKELTQGSTVTITEKIDLLRDWHDPAISYKIEEK